MASGLRSCALAVAAAALISSQAIAAAPVQTASSDPLVSLSLLSTTQSRAAVCATVSCAVPATVTTPAMAATTAAAYQGGQGKQVDPLILGLGVLIIIAIIVAILSGGGDGDGNLTPVSPD